MARITLAVRKNLLKPDENSEAIAVVRSGRSDCQGSLQTNSKRLLFKKGELEGCIGRVSASKNNVLMKEIPPKMGDLGNFLSRTKRNWPIR